MILMIKKNIGRNFKKGKTYDYPKSLWNDIAKIAGQKLSSFTSEPFEKKAK